MHVQYTVRPEFAATNQKNIATIVQELKILAHPGIKYSAWILPDGKTFMHFDQFENEVAHLELQNLASFKKFADELHSSRMEIEPKLDELSLVSSTEAHF